MAMVPAEWKLPSELIEFLQAGKQLAYAAAKAQVGEVVLKRCEDLSLGEIYVNSFDTPYELEDPSPEVGYYVVRAVGLVGLSNGQPDDGETLLWLPDYEEFGQWDSDHSNAIHFRRTKWRDIVADPVLFLNAIWTDDNRRVRPLRPWRDPHADFRPGDWR